MTSRRVSLEVLIDDKDPSRCGFGCPGFREYDGTWCVFFTRGREEDQLDGDKRHALCLAATALASADDAVLEAADAWDGGRDVTLEEASNIADRLEVAIKARRKLRGSKSE